MNTRIPLVTVIALLSGIVTSVAMGAERSQVSGPNAGAPTKASDMTARQFAAQVTEGGLAEVRLSELARQRTDDPQVRAFAERLIADHREANADLTAIARRKGIELPKEPDPRHEATMQSLQSKRGAEFDAAYLSAVKEEHIRTIALLQVANGPTFEDTELTVYASRALPVVETHFQTVERMEARKAGSAGSP